MKEIFNMILWWINWDEMMKMNDWLKMTGYEWLKISDWGYRDDWIWNKNK